MTGTPSNCFLYLGIQVLRLFVIGIFALTLTLILLIVLGVHPHLLSEEIYYAIRVIFRLGAIAAILLIAGAFVESLK